MLYEKGNVMFVSTPINYMKNSMSEEETIAFCKKIAVFWNKYAEDNEKIRDL